MAELDDDDDADDADMAMRLGFKATIVNYAHGTGQLCSVGAVKIPFTKFPNAGAEDSFRFRELFAAL
jgi:hypothetical protein